MQNGNKKKKVEIKSFRDVAFLSLAFPMIGFLRWVLGGDVYFVPWWAHSSHRSQGITEALFWIGLAYVVSFLGLSIFLIFKRITRKE